jgi:2-phosphoglycerate kinase
MIQVTKRDGRKQEFNSKKIVDSLEKCGLDELKSKTIALRVINELATDNNYEIEHIQNVVEKFLRKENKELQKKYHKYRQKRNNARNFKKDMELLNITLNKNEYLKTENSNKN